MANVSLANLAVDQSFDLAGNLVTYNSSAIDSAQSSEWSWITAVGTNDVQLEGSGLTFLSGAPTGGTISSFKLDLGNDGLITDAEVLITGLSVQASLLAPLVNGGLSDQQQSDLLWRLVLGGADTIDLGSTTHQIDISGDGRDVNAGQSVTGANDTIIGVASGYVQGEFSNVNAGGVGVGGDDNIHVTGDAQIFGEVYGVAGLLWGGDDTITVGIGETVGAAYGDVFAVTVEGVMFGGNDAIEVLGTFTLGGAVGDANIVDGRAIGGNDLITSGESGQSLVGDVATVGSTGQLLGGADTIHGGGGGDTIYGDWQTLLAGARVSGGNDILFGDAGNDTINGNGGDDQITGGTDMDTMHGGDGNDTLIVAVASDIAGGEIYDGGAGTDELRLNFTSNNLAELRFTTLTSLEALRFTNVDVTAFVFVSATQIGIGALLPTATITGSAGGDFFDVATDNVTSLNLSTFTFVNFASPGDFARIFGSPNAQTLVGSSGRNDIYGSGGNDTISGLNGNDFLSGEADNDTLNGGAGSDALEGGTGNDTYVLGSEANGVDTVTDSAGTDTITSTINRSLGFADYSEIENLTLGGTAAVGLGNANTNRITGNAVTNTLTAVGPTPDTLVGGDANDVFNIRLGDIVIEANTATSGASDIVQWTGTAGQTYALAANVERLSLMGGAATNAIGNASANTITGNTANNTIKGRDGNDMIIGGAGRDLLFGEKNNDTFRFTAVGDSAVGANRDVIFDLDDAGLGNDVIDLSLMAGVTTFIGAAAFTAAGQVRAIQAGANVLVQINTVGVTGAESEILIANATLGAGIGQVDAGDFLV